MPPSTSFIVAAMPPSPQTPPSGRPDPLTAVTSPAICPLWADSGRRCGCTRPPVESPCCGPATPAGGGRQLSRSVAASFTLLKVATFLWFGLLGAGQVNPIPSCDLSIDTYDLIWVLVDASRWELPFNVDLSWCVLLLNWVQDENQNECPIILFMCRTAVPLSNYLIYV